MTAFYSDIDRFPVSVDCIIFGLNGGTLSLLLTKRRMEPEKGRWSLMGGFVGRDESIDHAAARVLKELTGLSDVYMRQVGAFGAPDRDPGARVVSIAYCALINYDEHDHRLVSSHDACWMPLDTIPPLGFDHKEMVEASLAFIRSRLSTEPLIFNLLPTHFTLTALQQLNETVLGHPLDKRNFRKRIADNPSVVKTTMIDKTSSRRGAALYTYVPGNES